MIVAAACCLLSVGATGADEVARFDLTDPAQAAAWQPAHDVSRAAPIPKGLSITISGGDPYLFGPVHDYPAHQPLWLHLRIRSESGGVGQVFYFNTEPTEPNSVRFPVRAGRWEEIKAPLPALGPGYRLRLDPPGDHGTCLVSLIAVSTRAVPQQPEWPLPVAPALSQDTLHLVSGDMELIQAHHQFGGFEVRITGRSMAVGNTRPLIGYQHGDVTRWFPLAGTAIATATQDEQGTITSRASVTDPDGAAWEIEQRFSRGRPGEIEASISVRVDHERAVLFMPMLLLLPGAGGFGQAKHQALFAGLEYLDADEPSSSEADVIGPASHRQVPDSAKITLPLMAVQQGGRYVGLTWEPNTDIAALFDSPDRVFHAGGHLIGLIAPGSDGANREEGSLIPYDGLHVAAGRPLLLHATILGGVGDDVNPAVQQAVWLHGLPPVPGPGLDWKRYAALVSAGWLHSGLKQGDLYRHAYPNFGAQPAADAALGLDYLLSQAPDPRRIHELTRAIQGALAAIPSADLDSAGVGHVRTPAPALIFGHPADSLSKVRQRFEDLQNRFAPDGSVPYHKPDNGPNLGRTHFANESNGMAAQVVTELLETVALTGDTGQIQAALVRLRALSRFNSTVPRGAQTWEVPLHTPDILASAYLVRAYSLGFALTGDLGLLESARYWAWTGVPFIYLVDPVGHHVGLYATIPVYGATQWVAPVWMGLPVQWCGLVYADALYRLQTYDPTGPWERLADGITVSGIQQTWPAGLDPSRQGLLPDSYDLKAEIRNDPAINPATLFTEAVRYYRRPPLYDFRSCLTNHILIHAPGRIVRLQERPGRVTFAVEGWSRAPYTVLICGFTRLRAVHVNGKEVPLSAANQMAARERRLALPVRGNPSIQIDLR